MSTAVTPVAHQYIEDLQTGHDVKAALEQLQAQIVALSTAASVTVGTADGNGKIPTFG